MGIAEKNTIDICLSPRTENAPFQPRILLRITRHNDYVMRPRSYSRALRNRKTYANANANANLKLFCRMVDLPFKFVRTKPYGNILT